MERFDLAKNLMIEIARLGYSKRNFAHQTGISVESLCLYLKGKTNMSAHFLLAAVALGVDSQFVLTGVRSMNLNVVQEKLARDLDLKMGVQAA